MGRGACSHHGGVASWGPPTVPDYKPPKYLYVVCNDGFEIAGDDPQPGNCGSGLGGLGTSVATVFAALEDTWWNRITATVNGHPHPGPAEKIPTIYVVCDDGTTDYHLDPRAMCTTVKPPYHANVFTPIHILYITCNDAYVDTSHRSFDCSGHGGRFYVAGDVRYEYDADGTGFSPKMPPCVQWGPLAKDRTCTVMTKPAIPPIVRTPPSIESGQTMGETLLRSTVVSVSITAREGRWRCAGFAQFVQGDRAVVVTAGHCLQHDQVAEVAVAYAAGPTGVGKIWYVDPAADVAVVIATFSQTPNTIHGLCRSCLAVAPDLPALPVLSILTSGGGRPVISTGTVEPAHAVMWFATLPISPGTSGSPVVTPAGDLAGIVSAGQATVSTANRAAVTDSALVSGSVVLEFVDRVVTAAHANGALP
jgi:hypothetical protein